MSDRRRNAKVEERKFEEKVLEGLTEALEGLHFIARELREIKQALPRVYSVRVTQENVMANGLTPGVAGTFQAELDLNGAPYVPPAGQPFTPSFVWSSPDSLITVTPSADTTQAKVTVQPSDTQTSATIVATCTDPTGASQSGQIVVPTGGTGPQTFSVKVTQLS